MNGQTDTQHNGIPDNAGVRGRLREMFSRDLDPQERLLVVLRFVERMTYREIGLVLGMTTDQVEERLEALVGRLAAAAA